MATRPPESPPLDAPKASPLATVNSDASVYPRHASDEDPTTPGPGAVPGRSRPGRSRPGRSKWWLHPVTVAAVLAVAGLPVGDTVPTYGLDTSWQLGLSLMHLRDIAAGSGFVFTYGPLGFLAYPNLVWLPGALLGFVYLAAASFAFYYLVCRSLGEWLHPVTALVLTAALALVVARAVNSPEVATAALMLWSLQLVRPTVLQRNLPVWVAGALGCAAALQTLVKFSPGCVALAVALVVAVARPPRLENVTVLVVSFLASFMIFWLVALEPPAGIAQWLRGSLQVAAGYSAAMATKPGFDGERFWLLWLVLVAVIGVRLWRLGSEQRARAFPTVAIAALATWFFTKEGFVRLEQGHANIAYFGFAALIAGIAWEPRWRRLGLVGIVVALAAVLLGSGSVGTYPDRLRYLGSQPKYALGKSEQILRSMVDPGFRSRELESARQRLHAAYGLHLVAPGLRDVNIHVDPWEIAALWAYGLHWQPVPAIQAYTAYTSWLDHLNAGSLRSESGPDVVLRANPYLSLGNLPAWESPEYMVALTCGYAITTRSTGWQVLSRASNVCGPPRAMSQTVARRGETVSVPTARNPRDIVVATFDYPATLVERAQTLLIKPPRLPRVSTNGTVYGFLAATASQLHLVHVPETIGARPVTNGGLDIQTLSFPNAEGPVTVRFYELSAG